MHAYAVVNLGALELEAGDYHASLEYSTAAADLLREDEDESGLIVALHNCGWALLCLADPVRAEAHFREALVVAGQIEAKHRIAQLALALGAALVAQGEVERGTHLLGAGPALCEALDVPVFDDVLGQRIHEQAVADAKAALGEEGFAAAWAYGRAMKPEEIVSFGGLGP